MKTKRILFVAIAVFLIVTFAIVAFVACDKNGDNDNHGDDNSDKHQHSFSQEWVGDETYHWHPATCEHTEEMGDKAEHSFDSNGKCSVCNIFYGSTKYVNYEFTYDPETRNTYAQVTALKGSSYLDVVILDYYQGRPVTSIRSGAFIYDSIVSIKIPRSITRIGDSAFAGCQHLQKVYYGGTFAEWEAIQFGNDSANPVVESGSCDFYVKQNGEWQELTKIEIPEGVTEIKNSQYRGLRNLTSIVIPSTVTSIGEKAFEGCSSLTEITIPSAVSSIGYASFSGCSSLTEINIPNTVSTIEYATFSGCSSLTEITIPASVTNIERCAFEGCEGLQKITFEGEYPEGEYLTGAQQLGYFFGSSNKGVPASLKSVVITSGVIGDSIFDGCNSITDITILSGVTSIGKSAFSNMQNLHIVNWNATNCTVDSKSGIFNESCGMLNSARWNGMTVIIGENVEYINDYTFYGADIGTLVFAENSSLKGIGSYAFSSCHTLREIDNFPDNVEVADNAFSDSTMLTNKLSSYNPGNLFSWEDFVFYNDGGTYVLVDYVSPLVDTLLELPIGVYQYGIKLADTYRVGENAFIYRKDLVIAVPACAIDPPSGAFYGCTGRVIYLSNDERVQEEDGIVYQISADNSAKIIGAYCTGSATVPDGIESLSTIYEGNVSRDNFILDPTALTISSTVKNIGDWVFAFCSNVQTVTFSPDSQLQTIGRDAFAGCSSLTEITIPSSVKSINPYAFDGCNSLTSVTFENPVGWTANGKSLDLTDPIQNATYLKWTYFRYEWTRTE